ncbi:unnamed protein product [Owenia fusiformis]|uniref:Uncharacterized protein n=1 Tax=Owenia fusiformis TaxID=6347 RepID=A0A8J1YBD7_OWEFU|nr:unnamed protein product [Owenia fusiformis]
MDYVTLTLAVCIFVGCRVAEGTRKGNTTSCPKRNSPKNRTPTKYTLYDRTFTGIGDGKIQDFQKKPWPQTFQDFWKNDVGISREEEIRRGRAFVSFMKYVSGLDVSELTDDQIANGDKVDFGDFVFDAFFIDSEVRLLTETSQTRAKFFRNSPIKIGGFNIIFKKEVPSTGKWAMTFPVNASIFIATLVVNGYDECGLSEEPDILTYVPLIPYVVEDGLCRLYCEVYSKKYGIGIMHGLESLMPKSSPTSYQMAATTRFPVKEQIYDLRKITNMPLDFLP